MAAPATLPPDFQFDDEPQRQPTAAATLPADFDGWDKPHEYPPPPGTPSAPKPPIPSALQTSAPQAGPAPAPVQRTDELGEPTVEAPPTVPNHPGATIQAYKPTGLRKFQDYLGTTAPIEAIANTKLEPIVNALGIYPDAGEDPSERQILGHPESFITPDEARQSRTAAVSRGVLRAAGGLTSGKTLSTITAAAATGGLGESAAVARLISLGFSVQMANDLVHKVPGLVDSAKQGQQTGDWGDFYQGLGEAGFDATMLGTTAAHAAGVEPTVFPEWTRRGQEERATIEREHAAQQLHEGGVNPQEFSAGLPPMTQQGAEVMGEMPTRTPATQSYAERRYNRATGREPGGLVTDTAPVVSPPETTNEGLPKPEPSTGIELTDETPTLPLANIQAADRQQQIESARNRMVGNDRMAPYRRAAMEATTPRFEVNERGQAIDTQNFPGEPMVHPEEPQLERTQQPRTAGALPPATLPADHDFTQAHAPAPATPLEGHEAEPAVERREPAVAGPPASKSVGDTADEFMRSLGIQDQEPQVELEDHGKTETGSAAHGAGAGSAEEYARGETFYRVKRDGTLTAQSIKPDTDISPLRTGEAVIGVKANGIMRVQDQQMGLSDSQVLDQVRPKVLRAINEGKGEAAKPAESDLFGNKKAEKQTAVTGKEVAMMAPEDITVKAADMQPRRGSGKFRTNPEQVTALRESMRAKGFDANHPLVAWEDPDTGEVTLMEGHHRLEAALAEKMPEVPVELRRGISYDEAKQEARRSNNRTAAMQPMELANAFEKERDEGKTTDEIAKAYGGMKQHEVEDLLTLNQLEPSLQNEVQRGTFDVPRAVALAKATMRHNIPADIQRQAFDYVIKRREITPAQFGKLLDTFAPAAMQQMDLGLGKQMSIDGSAGLAGLQNVLDDYVAKMRDINRSKTRMRGLVNEVERMERSGEPVSKSMQGAKREAAAKVRQLEKQLQAMEEDAGSGKVFKTLGSAIEKGKEPEVVSPRQERIESNEPKVQPAAAKPTIGADGEIQWPASYQEKTLDRTGVGGGNYSADELAEFKNKHGIEEPKVEAEEKEPALPGMQEHVEAQNESAAEERARELSNEIASPREGNISKKAGEMERNSPLFRGTGASGQEEMFGGEPKVEDETKPKGGTTLFSGAAVADPEVFKQLFPDVSEWVKGKVDALTNTDLTSGDLEKGVLRRKGGELARKKEMLATELRSAKKEWDKKSEGQSRAFISAIETGKVDKLTGGDKVLAQRLSEVLAERRDIIRRLKPGALENFIENYFPHFWENPTKASKVAQIIMGTKRPFQGPASFLKQRTIPTTEEGIARGLKPVTYNPVDLALLKAHEMDRFIMAHEAMREMEKMAADPKKADQPGALRLATYADVGSKREKLLQKLGWKKYDDRVGTVYGRNQFSIPEYTDRRTQAALDQVLENFGIEHERGLDKPKGRPGALGVSYRNASAIETRAGTPLSVMAHEIMHQIDNRYDLSDRLPTNKAYKQELRDLSDLTFEGTDPAAVDPNFKRYVRKKEEKIAHMLEMYVSDRTRMRTEFPHIYSWMQDLIGSTPELEPLRDLKGGISYESQAHEFKIKGQVIRGYKWGPPDAVQVFNRHLSPGLMGRSSAFDMYRGASNTLNSAQLGLSAYHLGFTSLDTSISDVALGLEKLSRGNVKGLGNLARGASLVASPFENAFRGDRVMKEYLKPGSFGDYKATADAVAKSGGRALMDPFYRNEAIKTLQTAMKDGRYGTAARRAIPALTELATKPIMEWVVPRQKLGVFHKMASDIFDRADKENWSETRKQSEIQKAWDSVDNRLGQMVYDNLFWNRSAKDLAMASVRSVGWNLGTIREVAGGYKDIAQQVGRKMTGKEAEVTHRMAYAVALPMTVGLAGAVYQYLSTGKGPQETKDYFFPKNSNGDRVSLPSYMKDQYAWRHHPLETAVNKVNPLVSSTIQMLQNRDYFGNEIRNEDDPLVQQVLDGAGYMGKQFLPFSVRNAQQRAKQSGQSGGLAWLNPKNLGKTAQSFVGITPAPKYINNTDAEEKAQEYNRKDQGQGTRTKQQAEIRSRRQDLVQQLKAGTLDHDGLIEKIHSGEVSAEDAKYAWKAQKQGSALARNFQSLPIEQALEVWKVATPEEQNELRKPMARKVRQLKNRTPEERAPLLEEWRKAMGRNALPDSEPEVRAEY